MSEVFFYHLTSSSLEQTLPMLLSKARAAGWRVCVRGCDAARLDALDLMLWGRGESFLPHGRAGTEFDAEQPILLTEDRSETHQAACLICVDGAELAVDEISATKRAMVLFDGNDDGALRTARSHWKALTAAGITAKYWAQDGGKWVMKAQHPPPP